MKKKRFLILLAVLVLALVFAVAGVAEQEADITEAEANITETEADIAEAETGDADSEPSEGAAVRSIQFDESAAPYEGVWVTFDDGFQLYLPGEWLTYDVTEEQSGVGLFFSASNDGGDAAAGETPMGVAVGYVDADGLATLDDLFQDFERLTFANLEKRDVNGIPAVYFEQAGEDYRGVSFYHALYPDYVMTVYVTPMGEANDAVRGVGDAILDSLTPYAPDAEE